MVETAAHVASFYNRVAVLAVGENGETRSEDQMVAAWLARQLARSGFGFEDRSTMAEVLRWNDAEPSLMSWGRSAETLRGAKRQRDLDLVLTRLDDLDVVCLYHNGEIYAGGNFTTMGGVSADRIARYDGATWWPLGAGIGATTFTFPEARVIASFNGDLYAGGFFTSAGGQPASYIARWDSASGSWSEVAGGTNGEVFSLAVFDDGSGAGPALYVGGTFTAVGDPPIVANRIARWDGKQWSRVRGGLHGTAAPSVRAMTVFDDGSGSGPALFIGGLFTTAGTGEGAIAASHAAITRVERTLDHPKKAGTAKSANALVDDLLATGRYTLLLRPETKQHLTQMHIVRAVRQLDEAMALVPAGRVLLGQLAEQSSSACGASTAPGRSRTTIPRCRSTWMAATKPP